MAERRTEENGDRREDSLHQGRDASFMDIDRMINEGLGGGTVTIHNGLIEETTTDTMTQADSYAND